MEKKILEIINFIKKKPEILNEQFCTPSFKVIYSNRKKRYTEFHRLKVSESSQLGGKTVTYWIRIVKNKPVDVIFKALKKQYSILEELSVFFRNSQTKTPSLSISQPVVFLPDFNAIITRECRGQLFNDFLRKKIPFLSRRNIMIFCAYAGEWLKLYHQYYRDNSSSEKEISYFVNEFEDKYRKTPNPEMQYVTLCHNDYSPRNIFIAPNLIEVIDFVGVKEGLPELDIEFFTNYVINAKFNFLYPKFFREKMATSFRQGYEKGSASITNE